ncbi:MAG: hypothetical protein HFE75_04210 [Firmicutes bacterium]|jgi:DNA repair ATPase RecN|nr:hypothetical protein [Bacillota bacterium]
MTDTIMRKMEADKNRLEETSARLKTISNQLKDASAQLKHAVQSLAAQGVDIERIAEIMAMQEQQVRAYL